MNSEIIKAVFKAEGYSNVQIEVLPWSRVLAVVENDNNFIGGFAAYYSEERANKFIFSNPVNSSLIKFAERKDNPIRWNHFLDLKGKKIGVGQDYVNTAELDKLLTDNVIYADPAINDKSNLEKLAFKRTDLAIVDNNVFEYLMNTNAHLKKLKMKLTLAPKVIENKMLFVIFKKNAIGKKYVKIFNRGLKKVDIPKIEKDYMDEIRGRH